MVLAGLIKHVCHWWCVPPFHPACTCAAVPESALYTLPGWSSTVRTSMRCVSCVSPLHCRTGWRRRGRVPEVEGRSLKGDRLDYCALSTPLPPICILARVDYITLIRDTATFHLLLSGIFVLSTSSQRDTRPNTHHLNLRFSPCPALPACHEEDVDRQGLDQCIEDPSTCPRPAPRCPDVHTRRDDLPAGDAELLTCLQQPDRL